MALKGTNQTTVEDGSVMRKTRKIILENGPNYGRCHMKLEGKADAAVLDREYSLSEIDKIIIVITIMDILF
jgi:hypothetical protein